MNKDYAKTIRLSIAAKAAEIIMEEGIDDYQYAKKKAVKYLDLGSLDSLPCVSYTHLTLPTILLV